MRVALLISLAAAIGICATVANATTTRSDCALRSKTIKGHKAVVYCGPATASLHIAGKTYTFKNGTCIWSGGLILTVGTQVNDVPPRQTTKERRSSNCRAQSEPEPSTPTPDAFHIGMSLVKLTAHGHTSGTFKGREPIGAARPFTGSYHC